MLPKEEIHLLILLLQVCMWRHINDIFHNLLIFVDKRDSFATLEEEVYFCNTHFWGQNKLSYSLA